MHVDQAFVAVEVPTPHLLGQLPTREDSARRVGQGDEQLELQVGEVDGGAVDTDFMAIDVDRQAVELDQAVVGQVVDATAAVASAADGDRVSKRMSHEGSADVTIPENEHAFVTSMNFYVPTQRADGTVEPVEYFDVDEALVDTRDVARPLVGVYINGEVEHVDGVGFVGHGTRDACGAISLDDGETWKNTNLSDSADTASSDVVRSDVTLFQATNGEYPGDVVNVFHAVVGDDAAGGHRDVTIEAIGARSWQQGRGCPAGVSRREMLLRPGGDARRTW